MKIAWFSPLPPQKSGISEYSELIIRHLKEYAQVDLWIDGFSPRPDFYEEFKIIDYLNQPRVLPLLNTYDAIIYNMGNNAEFHSGMYEVLNKYPGIVILHDYVMHHFFAGYWIDKKQDIEGYFNEIRKQYGSTAEDEARRSLNIFSKPLWETEKVFDYPLNKSILEKSKGIIVHSDFVKNLITNQTGHDVIKLNHPVFPIEDFIMYKSRKELNLPDDKIILTSLGFITPNKRIDKILKIIANNEFLKKNSYVIIIGQNLNPNFNFGAYINELDLNNQIKLLGYLSIEKAYEYLYCSDICLNLRYPTMGETSGSLIRILSLGKPTIITNIGWYSEIPDDCAVKINPENEEEELTQALINLIQDVKLREKIGENARKYVFNNNTPEKFVQGLLNFINEVSSNNIYYKLIDNITDVLMVLNNINDKLIKVISENIIWYN